MKDFFIKVLQDVAINLVTQLLIFIVLMIFL